MTRIQPTATLRAVKHRFTNNHILGLADSVSWVYLLILVLLPLHAFLTTWVGSNFGHLDGWRIWKEVLITATVPVVLYIVTRDRKLRMWARESWLARLIYFYLALYIASGVIALIQGNTNSAALIYALFANLRFLAFFLLVAAISSVSDVMRRYALRIGLMVGFVVVLFGLMQLMLPNNFLTHFGYGPDTIPAFQTVDNKIEYQRIQSTLRGANPFGAYLIVLISLWGALWCYLRRYRLLFAGCIILAAEALFFSYSRSAYIGALLSGMVILWVGRPQWRRLVGITAGVVCLLALAGVFALRNTPVIQNTLFHSDNTSKSVQSSNAGRVDALKSGIQDVVREPLGRGPGTAGPESTRNKYPARIAENYYLQIGQEIGWLGIGLFVLIIFMVGLELWVVRDTKLALALLGSLVGISFVNLVSHAWADDTLGLLWWGLAGIVIGSGIMKSNHKDTKHETLTQKPRKRS